MPRPSRRKGALLLSAIAAALLVDAVFRARGHFDTDLIRAVRGTDFPGAQPIAEFLYESGDPVVLLVAWVAGVAAFGALRRWLELAAWASFAVAGAAAWALAEAIGRPRPGSDEVAVSLPIVGEITAEAFPSATVFGAVLLLGFLAVAGGRLERRWRLIAQGSIVIVLLALGWASVMVGRNWVGDVVAGYVIGGLVLLGVATAYGSMAPVFGRLPLVRAAAIPHDEAAPHAHALTSTVFFSGGVVTKVYNPGFVPRFAYWLSFQAPFAYAYNEKAVAAAVERRNLAGLLTEYWFGRRCVAPARGVARVGGRLAFRGEYTIGRPPADRRRARTFLAELSARFDESGLSTWQVDPRQPRSLGNILETDAGEFTVIDLESGMVSPLASPRAWRRALGRARVPIYDDVYFDVTRAYLEREAPRMRAKMGQAWVDRLAAQVSAAEAAQLDWHATEPRFWSAALRLAWSGFGVGLLWRWIQAQRVRGRDLALEWLAASIDRWEAEGRYTHEQAEQARSSLRDPALQDVLPHFGVHLVIGLALRFPFGSIVRASYVLGNLLFALGAFAIRKLDLRGLRNAVKMHSPLVVIVAAMPGIGTFSYLLSGPMIANRRTWRVAVDAVGLKLPFRVYTRLGVRRVVAGRRRRGPRTEESLP